jgi:flagellar protein FliT
MPALIQFYEAIADASRLMLAAARGDDWDEVERLEKRCGELIAQLKQAARTQPLGIAEQRKRIELLRAILANDAGVRARAEPWLQQLEGLIAHASSRRGVQH